MPINYQAAIVFGRLNEAPHANYSTNKNVVYSGQFYSQTSSQELSSMKLCQRFLDFVSVYGSTSAKAISAAVNGLDGLGAPTNV